MTERRALDGTKALQNWKIFLKALSKRLRKWTIKTKRLWQLKFLLWQFFDIFVTMICHPSWLTEHLFLSVIIMIEFKGRKKMCCQIHFFCIEFWRTYKWTSLYVRDRDSKNMLAYIEFAYKKTNNHCKLEDRFQKKAIF